MRCCVIGCDEEEWEDYGKCYLCIDLMRGTDAVCVSEYEAYTAWRYNGRDVPPPFYGILSDEEWESAWFGWWNEKVRR